jgi:CHAT domain-containing protein
MFLPLHAAGIYDVGKQECCSDYVVSSYAPTLTALLRAQRSNTSFSKREAKLSLIAAMKAQDITLPTLWSVDDEIGNVRAIAARASIAIEDSCVVDEATMSRVDQSLRSSNLAHIACHSMQDAKAALSSGFYLSDGILTITRLMDLDLKNTFFAFLSACETAKGDKEQPEQTVHLTAAMLFVGFRSVVATMW